jgi:predicted molibdopterin-dependent oxidoreductase YjgC
MTNSIRDMTEQSKCIFVIGSNATEKHPIIGIKVRRAKRHRGAKLIVADPRRIDLAIHADLHLRLRPGTDIALLNGLMHIIVREGWHDQAFIAERTEGFEELKALIDKYTPQVTSDITGVPVEKLEAAARMMSENRPGALLYAMGICQHVMGVNNVIDCANLQMVLGNLGMPGGGVNPLRGQSNVQGACDMGGVPNFYVGYQRVTDPAARQKFEDAWGVPLPGEIGLTAMKMMDAAGRGEVRCLYIIGEDPMTSEPNLNQLRHELEATEFVVVQDLFLTETAKFADVVLAGASFVEKEGTFTNTERRIQRVRKGVEPPGEAKPDSWIVTQLAKRLLALGVATPRPDAPFAGWDYAGAPDVMREVTQLSPIYAGVTYQRLEEGASLQWPVPSTEHPGTPILHTSKFTRGLGRFVALDHMPPDEVPDSEYPVMMTTGGVLYLWNGGAMTHHARNLDTMYPESLVEIHPADARNAGIADGQPMRITSRRGEMIAKAQVTDRVEPGLIFATFHYAEASANMLTNSALDPVCQIPEYKVCAVKIAAVEGQQALT